MDPYTINSEVKESNQNPSNKNMVANNSNETSIFRPGNEINPGKIQNRFISFITSKVGIIIISASVIAIVVGVTLGVVLSKDKNDNETTDNLIETNGLESDEKNSEVIVSTNIKGEIETTKEVTEEEKEIAPTVKEIKETDKIVEETTQQTKIDYVFRDKLLSDTLYVKKIDNLPEDFVLGMDLSSLIVEENSGVKYYNFEGEEKDVLEILRYVGINYNRIRIWNDPFDSEGHGYGGGNNDVETAVKIGKRATKYGMKILASYHYSDFYADPGSQNVPKAWVGLSLDEKAQRAEEFTKESLTRFKNEGIDIGMVALGNEINDFFCGETQWVNIVKILSACSKATREVFPEALVSVHFTNPEREGSMMYFAKSLNDNSLDYDAFSVSYYNVWAGDLDCLNQLNDVANTYNKKIYIAETQYPYTRDNLDYYPNKTPGYDDYLFYPLTVQGQANHIRNLLNHVVGLNNSLGVFYWEGAWIGVGTTDYYENLEKWEKFGSGWASSYSSSYSSSYFGGGGATENQALFDSEGKPLESLKVYNLIKYGNEISAVEDGVEDISVNPIDFSDFSLPNVIKVIDTSDQRSERNVIWNGDLDVEKAKTETKYEYTGKADIIDLKCVFENNLNTENIGRRFVCSYYVGDKFLSPLKLKSMIRVGEA